MDFDLGSSGSAYAAFGTAISTLAQSALNAVEHHRQYKYALKMAKNYPKAVKAGLLKAGVNPILAYGNMASSAPSVQMGSVNVPDLGANLVDGLNATTNSARAVSENALNESQMDLNAQNIRSQINAMDNANARNEREKAITAKQLEVMDTQKKLNDANIVKALSDSLGNIKGVKLAPLFKLVGLDASKLFGYNYGYSSAEDVELSRLQNNPPTEATTKWIVHSRRNRGQTDVKRSNFPDRQFPTNKKTNGEPVYSR